MPYRKNPVFIYSSVLEPWTSLALSAPQVVGLRLSILPLLWWSNPLKACQETQQMFSEKGFVWHETTLAMTLAPANFWFETLSATLSADPVRNFSRAMINSSRRMANPANQRVNANQKRLSRTSQH